MQPCPVSGLSSYTQGCSRFVRDNNDSRVVVLLSGGLDSTCLINKAIVDHRVVFGLGVDYGQRHKKELASAKMIAEYYGISFSVLRMPVISGSSLTGDGDVPTGIHYSDHRQSSTVVPGRNMLMIGLAISEAVKLGCSEVWYGAHSGDAFVYHDCREDFVDYISYAANIGYGVKVSAPWIKYNKKQIAEYAVLNRVPVELTWSCYLGQDVPCGSCGACIERKESFQGLCNEQNRTGTCIS